MGIESYYQHLRTEGIEISNRTDEPPIVDSTHELTTHHEVPQPRQRKDHSQEVAQSRLRQDHSYDRILEMQ